VGFHADFRRFKRRFAQVVLCFSKINGLIVYRNLSGSISGFSQGIVGFHADFRRFKRRFAQVVLCFSKVIGRLSMLESEWLGFSRGIVGFHADFRRFKRRFKRRFNADFRGFAQIKVQNDGG
jgi:hypothetical protein